MPAANQRTEVRRFGFFQAMSATPSPISSTENHTMQKVYTNPQALQCDANPTNLLAISLER